VLLGVGSVELVVVVELVVEVLDAVLGGGDVVAGGGATSPGAWFASGCVGGAESLNGAGAFGPLST